ncbi:MAG: prepilin-type N-terminal cleavage/methylation domain-containing protein [Planctomycetes bacterium]|nr:prepilin-type N-terminal cleavage/methylation domain-containing protein [Planctomycetota bacterium]
MRLKLFRAFRSGLAASVPLLFGSPPGCGPHTRSGGYAADSIGRYALTQRALVYGRNHRAFSLIELVIVVVIIGIIAAIAIPRLSRGAAGAAESALIGDLTVIRASIDLYTTEHVGGLPTLANFVSQMIQFSDVNGNTSATKTGLFIYGPYLRQIPPLPVGAQKGRTGIKASPADGVGAFGWVYSSGMIFANTAAGEVDDSGKPYNTY